MNYRPTKDSRAAWLFVAGGLAGLGALFAIGATVIRMVPPGIPWRETPAPVPAQGQRAAADTFTEHPAPDFDPKLTLDWPGTPEEGRTRINAGKNDEMKIYSAGFHQDLALPTFSAWVYEFSQQDAEWSDPNEMLAEHLSHSDEVELTRQQIAHGPNKHLGFDLTLKDADFFVRRVNVLVGRRIYTVEVRSTEQQRLSADDAVKFFESFAIKE